MSGRYQENIWTEWRVEALTRLLAAGTPYSAIGAEIGVTKNSAIGKARRLGLVRSKSETDSDNAIKMRIKRRSTPPKPRASHVSEPVATRSAASVFVTLDELQIRMCRWPFGDPRDSDFRFCGAPKLDGSSYCPTHRAIGISGSVRLDEEAA